MDDHLTRISNMRNRAARRRKKDKVMFLIENKIRRHRLLAYKKKWRQSPLSEIQRERRRLIDYLNSIKAHIGALDNIIAGRKKGGNNGKANF